MESYEKKQYSIVAIGVVVVLAIGFFRCKPLVARAQQLSKVKSEQLLDSDAIRTQMKGLPRLGLRMKELRNHVGEYHSKIPRNREFAGLWNQIAEVMNSLSLKDQSIQPGMEVLGNEINSIEITIKCTGTFSQLFEFFNQLNQIERVVRLENLKLTNSTTDPRLITMNSGAKIYYQLPEQEKNWVQQ